MPMHLEVPYCRAGVWPAQIAPSRFAAHVLQATPATARVALLGLPDDLGVALNAGRPGAREGPTAFRAALAKFGVHDPDPAALHAWLEARMGNALPQFAPAPVGHAAMLPRVFDAGDVIPAPGHDAAALAQTHDRVSEASAALVRAGLVPIAIGGGHDLTWAFVRGVGRGLRARGITPTRALMLYCDPHLDVRDTPGSGMSFRKLIDERIVAQLAIMGFSPWVNTRAHVEWFIRNRGFFLPDIDLASEQWASAFEQCTASTDALFCSFDMDVLDHAVAPGVSALNPDGLSVRMACKALASVARKPSLACLDLMELCPPHDPDGRTARVAALLFLVVLASMGSWLEQRSGEFPEPGHA